LLGDDDGWERERGRLSILTALWRGHLKSAVVPVSGTGARVHLQIPSIQRALIQIRLFDAAGHQTGTPRRGRNIFIAVSRSCCFFERFFSTMTFDK
jgi:hypothetical protein